MVEGRKALCSQFQDLYAVLQDILYCDLCNHHYDKPLNRLHNYTVRGRQGGTAPPPKKPHFGKHFMIGYFFYFHFQCGDNKENV